VIGSVKLLLRGSTRDMFFTAGTADKELVSNSVSRAITS
jgi:hypothetical protein